MIDIILTIPPHRKFVAEMIIALILLLLSLNTVIQSTAITKWSKTLNDNFGTIKKMDALRWLKYLGEYWLILLVLVLVVYIYDMMWPPPKQSPGGDR